MGHLALGETSFAWPAPGTVSRRATRPNCADDHLLHCIPMLLPLPGLSQAHNPKSSRFALITEDVIIIHWHDES